MKNPDWTRDEHIIALDFYLSHAPSVPGRDSSEILDLSRVLNGLNSFLENEKSEKFRNPSGVYMKLMNFRRFDPAYKGVGLAHGNKDEKVVWDLFAHRPAELAKIAKHIKEFSTSATKGMPLISEDEEEGNEGQILSRVHRYRERDRTLVSKKKIKFLQENPKLFCQGCGFDFQNKYGDRGKDFIECHHTKPVSELSVGETTKLLDLVLLCSNCHRIVHRKKPWLTLDELKQLVITNGK
jgi:5-methylcytosine-specific restriction protein A